MARQPPSRPTRRKILMQYKTIMHELIQEFPELHQQLCKRRILLQSIENYARTLKYRHLYWMDQLDQERPASDQRQLSSAALELAVQDLREILSADSPPVENAWEP